MVPQITDVALFPVGTYVQYVLSRERRNKERGHDIDAPG